MSPANLQSHPSKKTLAANKKIEVFLATAEYAAGTAAMFNSALGSQGIAASGHEPYPDPSLFTEEGILENIAAAERNLFIATVDDTVAGGMIVDSWSPYNCENNCMATAKEFRGLGLGSRLVEAAKAWLDSHSFRNNITECVTHNMLSQSSHKHNGYNKILGFGYAHYPCVFFPDHPESVIWQGQLHGLIARELPFLREALPDIANKTRQEIIQALETLDHPPLLLLTPEDKSLAALLLAQRCVYVPPRYQDIAGKILNQYAPCLSYSLNSQFISGKGREEKENGHSNFHVDLKPGYDWTYITFPAGFSIDKNMAAVKAELKKSRDMGKRYIQCRIEANHPSAVAIADFLQGQGFVFHSILPLYTTRDKDASEKPDDTTCSTRLISDNNQQNNQIQDFNDLLVMQWIHPDIAKANPLPGQTGSVIQLYGYPLGLTGEIIKLLGSEHSTIKLAPST